MLILSTISSARLSSRRISWPLEARGQYAQVYRTNEYTSVDEAREYSKQEWLCRADHVTGIDTSKFRVARRDSLPHIKLDL